MLQCPEANFVAGNYFDKYRSTNRIHQRLITGFLNTATDLVRDLDATSILEAGAGPGDLAAHLIPAAGFSPYQYLGTDISEEQVAAARATHPDYRFETASIYELPVEDKSFDLTIACEVLEHLEEPEKALRELVRVTRSWVLLSVPSEPLWRTLNVLRGKYLTSLGNTPGHLQNFTPKAIRKQVSAYFEIVTECRPLPWTMFLLRPKTH